MKQEMMSVPPARDSRGQVTHRERLDPALDPPSASGDVLSD